MIGLAEKGFGREPLAEMQKIIEAQNSDLFDVLAYVAFAAIPITREERANAAKSAAATEFSDRQRAFVEFILAQYAEQGVDEVDQDKLPLHLRMRYGNSLPDAFEPERVRAVYLGMQRRLYESTGQRRRTQGNPTDGPRQGS